MFAWKYTLKVWLSSVLAAPLLMLVQFYYGSSTMTEAPQFYGWMVFYGLVFSLPSALCLWLAIYLIEPTKKTKTRTLKVGLSLLGFMLVLLPFWIFQLLPEEQVSALCYAITIIAGIWYYDIKKDERTSL